MDTLFTFSSMVAFITLTSLERTWGAQQVSAISSQFQVSG